MGTDEWQAAKIDALIDFVGDVANGTLSNYYSIFSSSDDKLETLDIFRTNE